MSSASASADTPPLYHAPDPGAEDVALVASLWHTDRARRDERCERLFALLDLASVADDLVRGPTCMHQEEGMARRGATTAPQVLLS